VTSKYSPISIKFAESNSDQT